MGTRTNGSSNSLCCLRIRVLCGDSMLYVVVKNEEEEEEENKKIQRL